jgi:hypothetical protein
VSRYPADDEEPRVRRGIRASIIAAFRISQVHASLYQLCHRPSWALAGAAVPGLVVLATVPITGPNLWSDWVVQVRRAADADWTSGASGWGIWSR